MAITGLKKQLATLEEELGASELKEKEITKEIENAKTALSAETIPDSPASTQGLTAAKVDVALAMASEELQKTIIQSSTKTHEVFDAAQKAMQDFARRLLPNLRVRPAMAAEEVNPPQTLPATAAQLQAAHGDVVGQVDEYGACTKATAHGNGPHGKAASPAPPARPSC